MDTHHNSPPEAVSEQLEEFTPRYSSAVLQYFHRHSTEVATVDELEGFVCNLDQPDGDGSRVATRLHHATLPKLAATGLIDYDPRSKTARYSLHPGENE